MKIYYVADSIKNVRISIRFTKMETAQKYCGALNAKHPGRFHCGDWVNHNDFGKSTPHEWPWVSQSTSKDYLV